MRKIKEVSIVVDVFKLSNKYLADVLLYRSLLPFTALYPCKLLKWKGRRQRRQFASFDRAYGKALPFVVIDVARRAGMEVILPSAMLDCCSYSVAEIMDGVRSPEGKLFILDHDTQRRILEGRDALARRAYVIRREVDHLDVRSHIGDYRQQWQELSDWANGTNEPNNWVDPFSSAWPARAYTHMKSKPMRYRNLKRDVETPMQKVQEDVWRDLPSMLGLGSWESLKRVTIP